MERTILLFATFLFFIWFFISKTKKCTEHFTTEQSNLATKLASYFKGHRKKTFLLYLDELTTLDNKNTKLISKDLFKKFKSKGKSLSSKDILDSM